jgi:hypothetical protein
MPVGRVFATTSFRQSGRIMARDASSRGLTRHPLLTSALALVVLVANAAPQAIGSCATQAVAKKCCGCCKSHSGPEVKSCCAKRLAQTTVTTKPNCCCSKAPARPAAPAPSDAAQLVKQILLATQLDTASVGLTLCDTLDSHGYASTVDISTPPARVLFSVWLI